MPDDPLNRWFLIVGLITFTAITSWTDLRARKIHNWTTLPMWIVGWAYQFAFFQWEGISNGLSGFVLGFGMFFVLWNLKVAGGGDVKLMAALGVWLGGPLTMKVIIASLIFVASGIVLVILRRRLKTSPPQSPGASANATRLMAFAPPVALGTWSVLLLFQGQW